MTILSAQTLSAVRPLGPWREKYTVNGVSGGLGSAGYDVAIAEGYVIRPGDFRLASTVERFVMPKNILGIVHDKSTWARRGIALQNTVIEPGWEGYLTLEITNHGNEVIRIEQGSPIAQIVFHWLDQPTMLPYTGKYQDQASGPQPAILA